ncbi:MAG: TIGR02281 family clan AA aspartic protease [Candidatus Omnitrophota bacterium]
MPLWLLSMVLFFGLFSSTAFGDMVYLKNGESIEGIIEKEDKDRVSLHLGYGKIALKKKNIASIRRYDPQEQERLVESWNTRYFSQPQFIPKSLLDLAADFENLKNLRGQALQSKKEKDKILKESQQLEKNLLELNSRLALVSDQLGGLKPKDNLEKYNALVNEFNSMMAKIKLSEYNVLQQKKKMKLLDKNISDFIREMGLFRNRFSKKFNAPSGEASGKDAYFFKGVAKELDIFESDFTKYPVGFQRLGLNIVVEVLLNGHFKTRLMVDTGASLVVLSRDIADQIGLDTSRQNPSLFLTLADGKKIPTYPVTLKSVRVGDTEVKNVRAAVLESSEPQEIEGLLGMSFLENFVVKIDAKNERLIFEEFNP